MKIYLVMSYDAQEGDRLLHVASTKEKAQSWLERHSHYKGPPWFAEIGEYYVDKEEVID